MSKILANEIANYGDDAPIDLKEGLNIPAGKPIQAAGLSGTSGQVLSSTGTSINWITPFDGDYTSLTNKPTIPAAQINSDWNATSGVAVILNKPTVPPLTSLVTNPAGTPSLTFNGANGQFTYTPPDLSNYDTAFGWGDHAQAGYLTAEADTHQTVTDRSYYPNFPGIYGQTRTNAVIHTEYPVFYDPIEIQNDVYFLGGTDAIHISPVSSSVKFLDYDVADQGNLPNGGGSNLNKVVAYTYYVPSAGWIRNGLNHTVGDVFHMDVQPDTDGNPTTLSLGNDLGTIRLGNRQSTISYLTAEPIDAAGPHTVKLFFQNEPVLQTVPLGVELPNSGNLTTKGQLRYSNIFGTTALLPLAADHDGMFGTLNDGKAYFSKNIGTTITVTVGVDTVGGQATGVFYFNGVERPAAFPIARGSSYTFNQNDSSNATYNGQAHPLMFSLTEDGDLVSGGAHYDPTTTIYRLDGVVKTMAEYTNEFASATLRTVTFTPPMDAPNTLWYWCHFHTGQGNTLALNNNSWTKLQDSNSTLGDLSGVDLSTPPTTGQVLKFDGNNWVAGPDNAGSGGTGIALTDISVTTATAGSAALTYNNVSGVFTYTPPDVSNFLTSFTETDPVYSASPAAGILSSNISNWDTAYGWGNHASAGYLTSETSHADVVVDGDFTSAGLMSRGGTSGTYSIVTDNSNNWNTAYGWGNHASAGYLTSYTVTASDLNSISITALSDVNTAGASVNDVLKWNGSAWTAQADATGGGGGGANVTISDTAPGGASVGDLWWESDKGRLKIYYQDVDTTQWVDASPPLAPALSSNAPSTASSAGSAGDIRYDSGYVYVCIATNTWKRAALTTW